MITEPLPLSRALLEQYRIASRHQKRPGLVGGHRMRRKGQSLEFRDYRPYLPGDDVRHVDWRASARHGGASDWLLRTFVAEEHLTLVISIDTRETMHMPVAMPKGMIAGWLAEAASWITLRSGDRVILHRLFGSPSSSIKELHGTGGLAGIRKTLHRFYADKSPREKANVNILQKYLQPAAIWLIISDFYFDMEAGGEILTRRIAEAQDGMRWIILLDTDSWPFERHYLGEGPRIVEGPGSPTPDQSLEIDAAVFTRVEERITQHREYLCSRVGRGAFDYISWKWPVHEQPDARAFFQDHFGGDRVLQRLFMRENQ